MFDCFCHDSCPHLGRVLHNLTVETPALRSNVARRGHIALKPRYSLSAVDSVLIPASCMSCLSSSSPRTQCTSVLLSWVIVSQSESCCEVTGACSHGDRPVVLSHSQTSPNPTCYHLRCRYCTTAISGLLLRVP